MRGGGDPYWGGYYYYCGDYYYWDGYYYSPFRNSFSRYHRVERSYVDRYASHGLPVSFPPVPPPLGAPLPRESPNVRLAAPQELEAHIYEPFYASLSTRLLEKNLNEKLRGKLTTSAAARQALTDELHQRLEAAKTADAAARRLDLESFSREQTGRAIELENQAEQLRGEFLRSGVASFFLGSGDWNENRNWRLGTGALDRPREDTLSYEFRVMRAAAYYQEGLSPAQRRLLREIAMELQIAAFKPKDIDDSDDEEPLLWFYPETSRIRLPADLPPGTSAKIAAFEKEKAEVKTELRDALYLADKQSRDQRQRTLSQLAETQRARLESLELLAEDIRIELSAAPQQPGPASLPAFPPELSARIAAYQKGKAELQAALQTKLKEVGATRPSSRARLEMDAFNRQHADRFAALGRERDSLRTELARFAETTAGRGKSVDTLMKEFVDAKQRQDIWHSYRDYQLATLQPGLSPELRRLLFGTALEKLSLPLPSGEYQP